MVLKDKFELQEGDRHFMYWRCRGMSLGCSGQNLPVSFLPSLGYVPWRLSFHVLGFIWPGPLGEALTSLFNQ